MVLVKLMILVWYFIFMILSCIDTIEVILSDWRDTAVLGRVKIWTTYLIGHVLTVPAHYSVKSSCQS